MPEMLSRITPPSELVDESAKSSMAEKVLLILETIAHSEFPLTLEVISTSTNLAKPTAFRLLNTLVAHGFIERDPNGRRFQPSSKLRILGINILSVDSVRSQRVVVMKRLVAFLRIINASLEAQMVPHIIQIIMEIRIHHLIIFKINAMVLIALLKVFL